jgi:hypothetical protein
MGRSNGYRPKAAVRKEVLYWRDKLNALTDDQWMKASCYMDNITTLLGHTGGPMGGRIEPRACKYCHHFGHTRQWCKARIADEQAREEQALERMLAEDRALGIGVVKLPESEWTRYCRRCDSAYRELCDIKEDWSDEEWAVEYRKRVGHFDHETCVWTPF